MSHYDVLGVGKTASQEEIKRAYRRKAAQMHPDRNDSSTSVEEMARINVAYEVLSDPEKRKRYDDGEIVTPIGREARGHTLLRMVALNIMRIRLGEDNFDLVYETADQLDMRHSELKNRLGSNRKRRKQLKKLIRAATKKNKEHPLLSVYDVAERALRDDRIMLLSELSTVQKAGFLLVKDYDFEWDKPQEKDDMTEYMTINPFKATMFKF